MTKPNTLGIKTNYDTTQSLAEGWRDQAENWIQWARKPDHDCYWKYHREQFLQIIPRPGKLTVDIGCGEGRLSRDMKKLGHRMIGIDVSEALIAAAKEVDPDGKYLVADATQVPLDDGIADLILAFMSPMDIDDLDASILEMSRLLVDGGRACIAIVHPLNSAGKFTSEEPDSEFVIKGSYLQDQRYSDEFNRDGLAMVFHSVHRPLERYSRALERAGFLMESIRENPVPESAIESPATKRWQRLPLFLHIRAVKPGRSWNPKN